MSEGPYIIWHSDVEYTELWFEQENNDWTERQLKKNIQDHPTIEVDFNGKNIVVPLQRKFAQENSLFNNVNKIIAFGDIHGRFDKLVQLLSNHSVIDDNYNWTFDNGHLVFCGDIFDRGNQVTECLWLIYHLEQQATEAGGCVHFILGNHEIMLLTGDHRYLNSKYKVLAAKLRLEYQDLFQSDAELGRWLRSKNLVKKIDQLLFVHAGLHPSIHENIDELNNKTHAYLSGDDQYFYFINDPSSPLWYRGYMYAWEGQPKATQKDVNNILNSFEANKLIFAHTEVEQITPMYENHLIAVDVPFKHFAQALMIEENNFYAIDEKGKQRKLF